MSDNVAKPHKKFAEQLDILRQRGLIINDEEFAEHGKPKLHKNNKIIVMNDKKIIIDDRYIFSRLLPVKYLSEPATWRNFLTSLLALITQYNDAIKLNLIGFPINWYDILKNQ